MRQLFRLPAGRAAPQCSKLNLARLRRRVTAAARQEPQPRPARAARRRGVEREQQRSERQRDGERQRARGPEEEEEEEAAERLVFELDKRARAARPSARKNEALLLYKIYDISTLRLNDAVHAPSRVV